ncbi:MAG TPA: class I SAM-dependent methyltransferase, partial [Terriglobales bacterium]|nr:class I SAM-dependent methyltransferase [Terriglobales bacterium]
PTDRPRCAALLADACRLPFADGSFDLVVCMEVFEHIAEPEAMLREIARVAAPGAHWLLSCPNYCNFFLPIKLLADSGIAACRRYINRQPLDHTLFAFRVRRQLARHAEVLEQRAIRLHPPLFERLDYRFGPGRGLARVNDGLFRLEQRCGAWPLVRHLGLHTCFLLRSPPRPLAG